MAAASTRGSGIGAIATGGGAVLGEQERLALILEATDVATWQWNVSTGEVRFNARWAEIIGYTLAELGPTSLETFLSYSHPEDRAEIGARLEAHFAGKALYECEVRMKHREGHWVWVLAKGRVMTWTPDGKPEWMFGTHLDLTARKAQDEALRKSESFLHRTGTAAGIGGWEYHLAEQKMVWSAQVCRIHGLEPGFEPTYEDLFRFFPPDAKRRLRAALKECMTSRSNLDLELPLVQQGGRCIWVRLSGTLEIEDDRPIRLVGAFQDVTSHVEHRNAIERSRQRLALANDSGSVATWDFDLATKRFHFDALACHFYGLPGPTADVALDDWLAMIHPEDRASALHAANEAIGGKVALDIEVRVERAEGKVRYLRSTARMSRDDNGVPARLTGINLDITQVRELSTQLEEQLETTRVTLKSIADAVVTTDARGFVTWLNPVAERMAGWSTEAAAGRRLGEVVRTVESDEKTSRCDPVESCLRSGLVAALTQRTLLESRTGERFGVEGSAAPIRNERGVLLGAVLVLRDVTEQRRIATEMTRRAKHDELTGLVNRAELESRLRRALDDAREEESEHALLCIDLDHFKLVNDACGHSVGDRLLKQVSRLLTEAVRASDTVARVGGDEFAIVLEHCPLDQAERIAQKICDEMDVFRFVHEERRFRIGTSIGVALVHGRWPNAEAVMKAADASCFRAKEGGRNRVHVWFDSDAAILARDGETKWGARLEDALDNARFVLHAQRISPIAPPAGRTPGLHAEVLVRLTDTDGTIVPPNAFLPAAERFHLAARIDRWVLGHALDTLAALPDLSVVEMLCINLSGQSIGDRTFHHHAIERLLAAGSSLCQRICLEITETTAITNLSDAASFIAAVRELGVRVALDDFGAGASSFGYLKSLPVDLIKIDGQFIENLLDDPLDDTTVRCFAAVARAIGVKTVAEYVGRAEVLERLAEIGIDYAQGFFLHRPEPLTTVLRDATLVAR